jgi:hypothetical protein
MLHTRLIEKWLDWIRVAEALASGPLLVLKGENGMLCCNAAVALFVSYYFFDA